MEGVGSSLKTAFRIVLVAVVCMVLTVMLVISNDGFSTNVVIPSFRQSPLHAASALHKDDNYNYTPVILLTYFRSGSSVTGEVMQQHEDAFYVFEPLKAITDLGKRPISYLNGSTWYLNNDERKMVLAREAVIEGWLTCNFSLINIQSFYSEFMNFGRKTAPVLNCLKKHKLKKGSNNTIRAILPCIQSLQNECSRSKYRIVKTIRLRVDEAVPLTRKIQNLKIIHLVRDPRGTVESRRNRKRCPIAEGGVIKCAKDLCADLTRDIDAKAKMTSSLAERIHTVRYEEMAHLPNKTAQALYQFIGIPFLKRIQSYVVNLTQGSNANGCVVCKQQWQLGRAAPDATMRVGKWKGSWKSKDIEQVQTLCKSVMNHYNYTFD